MKITDIHVDGFGVWNTMSAGGLSEQVTLFYGPNEAGKTTLMQFVRAVLYGFSDERRRLYLPPVFGGTPGGLLRVQNHNGEYTIERRLEDGDQTVIGRAVVLAENGSRQGQHLLSVLLSGIDESIFHNVFAVGIRELQELATLNDTQAAEQLYNLASGVDRVSLVEVMRRLESERLRLWQGEGQPSELAELLGQRNKLSAEIDGLERQTRRWIELAQQQRSLVGEIDGLERKISQFEFDARTAEIAIQVRDKWRKRSELSRQLGKIGQVDALPDGCLDRLEKLNQDIAQQRDELKPQKQRRLEVRRELAAQPINKDLWERACRIEAMCEHGPWLASLDHEISHLQQAIAASRTQLVKYDEELAAAGGVALAEGVVISPRTFQQLQAPAQVLRDAWRKREMARAHYKKTRQEASQAVGNLEHELRGRDPQTFEQTIDRAAHQVKLLRRRMQLDEQIDSIHSQSQHLEHDNQELLDSQLQRIRLLAGIGGIFIFGMVLMLTAVFGHYILPIAWEIRWGLGLLGLLCTAVAMAWKTMVEQTAQQELNECFQQREALEQELAQALEDREELDRQLPTGAGTLATRLAAAEKELRELEAKMPLQIDRQQAERRTHDSKRYRQGIEDELREAKARWRRGLRAAGLPETLSPKHVRQLSAHHEKKSKVQRLVDEQSERLTKLEGDRNVLVERLAELNSNIGLAAVSDNPHIQLSQLAAALSGQREMVQRRRELQRTEKEVRRELAEGLQTLRRWQRSREALFAEARVTDEEQLRERAATLQLIADLTHRREALSEQIVTIIGTHCSEDVIETMLGRGDEELDTRWKLLTSKLQDAQTLLGQLHQRHGEVNQEMKSLSENQRLAAARFELGCLEQEIAAAVQRWRTLAVTLRMLEDIRESYEAERQPETLSEASLYLQKLTDGKYTRVWTPLGKNELRVDDAQERPLALDVLSRGTREAIFLSLRLALVAAYGRRGVNIPMILDDVLVNLDAKRAEAAVALLCEFAKAGRQLLFFTCHEHIRNMFLRADVDVRVLPAHGTPGLVVERWHPAEPVADEAPLDFIPPPDEEDIPAEVWEAASPIEEPIVEVPAAPVEELEAEEEIILAEPEPEPDSDYRLQEPLPVAVPPVDLTEFLTDPEPEDTDSAFDEARETFVDDTWWWEPVPAEITDEERTVV